MPILITLVTVPIYLTAIGEARYGVLALVWVLTGYFGFFEMGMGRASAYHIAKLRSGEPNDRKIIFWSALLINSSLGLFGAILFFFIAQFCLSHFFNIPKEFLVEITGALPWIALTIPVSTISSVGQGTLQGRERFLSMNLLGVLSTVLNQVAPLVAAILVSPELEVLVTALVCARLFGMLLLFEMVRRSLPVRSVPAVSIAALRSLISFGGWVSVSSIIGPLLTTADRLLIGGISGPVALTHYTIPINLTRQFTLLSSSLTSVLFPRFASQSINDRLVLAQRAIRVVSSLLTPCIVIAMFCMSPFLSIWIGAELSQVAAPIGVIMLTGIWFNSLALIPFGVLQGSGRPRSTAKAHLCEVPFYLFALYFATKFFGIVGAASVTVARLTLDAFIMTLLARMRFSWFCYLIPYITILVFSQIAAFCLPTFSILRFIVTLILCILLICLGCQNSTDFAMILRKILNYLHLQREIKE